MSGSALASAAQSGNRLLYATPVFTDTVHISGTTRVTLRIASSKPAANLSVWLVMLPYQLCARVGLQSHAGSITHGWADIQNYKSLTKGGCTPRWPRLTAHAGKFVTSRSISNPDDEFVPAGKQLAVMITSSDREFTLWPQPGTELTVDLAKSSFSIPIVGGANALEECG